jgi:hypothetical protein
MGRSEGAIKSLYHRTLVSLKELLTEQEHPAAEVGAAEASTLLPGNSLELKELEELREK